MKDKSALFRVVFVSAAILMCSAGSFRAQGVETYVTNFVERTITNVIELSVPINRFVNEYRTNRVEQLRTNTFIIYTTNWWIRAVTNHVTVAGFRTNFVPAYRTNWETATITKTNWVNQKLTNLITVDAFQTNFVDAYTTNHKTLNVTNWETVTAIKTNWVNQRLTNLIALNAFRTNFVEAYTTNRKTLNLTNWETVVVIKTNWVTQQLTNVAQIDLSAKGGPNGPKQAVEPKGPSPENFAQPVTISQEAFHLEASRTTRLPVNNHVEVELRVKPSGAGAQFQVLRWRVERDDGTILSFGQEQEFKRDLPVGRYKVEARVLGEAGTLPKAIRGILEVTVGEAVIQQQPLLGKN